jgi:hypothetical protein
LKYKTIQLNVFPLYETRGHRGRDRMVVGFITTYAINCLQSVHKKNQLLAYTCTCTYNGQQFLKVIFLNIIFYIEG